MSKILVLGAGFVAAPLVEYLSAKGYELTVASQFIDEAEAIAVKFQNISTAELDVTNSDSLGELVKDHDIVVSFVPYMFHVSVARQCIEYGKHMVTASYESAEMKALNSEAEKSGITILNEIGLDPGIDHLSAMEIIDSIHEEGGKLNSFVSWCGGLPAPSANNNPLGYKFAWAPKSVLMALLNEATFLKGADTVTIAESDLLKTITNIDVSDELKLEGYPNRDSVSYKEIYGITEADNILRGTLRYRGFSEILQTCKELKLLDSELVINTKDYPTWELLLAHHNENMESVLADKPDFVIEALDWLGLTKDTTVPNVSTFIDAFCGLLVEKLAYQEGEQDMVVLQHQFGSTNSKGEKEFRESTLILEGEKGGYSAMAKTVGTPAAIATDLIAKGEIALKGVILPMSKEVYTPILKELSALGIKMEEKLLTGKEVDFL